MMPDRDSYGDSLTTGSGFGDYPECANGGCMHEVRPGSAFCGIPCERDHARKRKQAILVSLVALVAILVPLALLVVAAVRGWHA